MRWILKGKCFYAICFLLGIRFDYYDDDFGDERQTKNVPPPAVVTAKRVNDGAEAGQKEGDKNDTPAETNVLKLAAGTVEEEDTCQVIPVGELRDYEEHKENPVAPTESNGADEGSQGDAKDKSGSEEQVGTPEETSGSKGQAGTPGETSDSKEQANTPEQTGDSKEPGATSEVTGDSKGPAATPEVKTDSEEAAGSTSEEKHETKRQVVSDVENVETKDNAVSEQTESDEVEKDDFIKVVESIKQADINIDGTERPSPQAMLRKLSVNSSNEIMDKVVKLRILKQNLKVRHFLVV